VDPSIGIQRFGVGTHSEVEEWEFEAIPDLLRSVAEEIAGGQGRD
jgi:hypothetical protein